MVADGARLPHHAKIGEGKNRRRLNFESGSQCIALSCLVAHGDINELQKSKIQKTPYADELMNILDKLHPNFYPIPVVFQWPQPNSIHIHDKITEHLSKEKLILLVRYCGAKVHRGPIGKYIFAPTTNQLSEDFRKITSWTNEIISLLDGHRISLISGSEVIIAQLLDIHGNVSVALGEAPGLPAHEEKPTQ